MHRNMRTIAAMGFLGCATLTLLPLGCGGIETVANPAVLWAVLLLFAELTVEVGGIEVVFAVSLEMVAVAADVLIAAKRKKDKCTDYYEKCVESSLWHKYGRHEWDSLCSLCAGVCYDNNGNWPSQVAGKDCNYKGN